MHVLVVSPIPSHPQFQGNSMRIFRLCRMLQFLGCKVHFLYYPLEGLTPEQRGQMAACWDYFYSLPCDLPNTGMTLGDHYGIDDWYDPRVGELASALHERWNYQAVIVNYVWFSGVLDALPDSVTKIIDTHDVFGDRHLRSLAAGMKPEWFYTSVAEEKRGLLRADIVFAIQNEEEKYFASLGLPRVETVGFVVPPQFLPAQDQKDRPIVGYIASSNPWNVNSFLMLAEELKNWPELVRSARFFLAGPICRAVEGKTGPFTPLGIVPSVDAFYRSIDIAINPMIGGTGLKIKSVEALSYGRPFLSTVDGMVGLVADADHHVHPDLKSLCNDLNDIVLRPVSLRDLAAKSRFVFNDYTTKQMKNFKGIIDGVALAHAEGERGGA